MDETAGRVRRAVPVLMLVATALLFATGGAAIKATTLTAWQTAALRSGVAAAALWLSIPEARRQWSKGTIWVALAYAATLELYVHATKRTTAANAVFLQAAAPLYLMVIGPLLLKEKPRRADAWTGLLLAAGMGLFLFGSTERQATAPDPATGNLMAAASGLTWALTLAGMRRLARSAGGTALPVVVAGNLLVFLLSLPGALPMGVPGWKDIAVILYLGCAQVGLAYWLLAHAIRRVPAFEASLILLLEPVSNPLWSWLIHGERMSEWALAGAACVLAGVAWQAWHSRVQPALSGPPRSTAAARAP
ncbi:MAG: DMT family transporter [Bryobacteraceae bacterium]